MSLFERMLPMRRLLVALVVLALLALAAMLDGTRLVAQGEQEDTFVPTEQLPADSAISFPVDI